PAMSDRSQVNVKRHPRHVNSVSDPEKACRLIISTSRLPQTENTSRDQPDPGSDGSAQRHRWAVPIATDIIVSWLTLRSPGLPYDTVLQRKQEGPACQRQSRSRYSQKR